MLSTSGMTTVIPPGWELDQDIKVWNLPLLRIKIAAEEPTRLSRISCI